MIKVRIKFFADLKALTKKDFIEVNLSRPVTLRELLREASSQVNLNLEEKLLKGEKIREGFMILINGRNAIYLNQAETLIDGGEIAIFPPAGGG